MEFLSHFEELRKRFLLCLSSVLLTSVVSFFFSNQLIDWLIWPLTRVGGSPQLYFHAPHEAFLIHIKVALFCGLLISSPVLIFQAWQFTAPGLYEKEKNVFRMVVPTSILLFLAGVGFAYYLVAPWGLGFMLQFRSEHLAPLLQAGPYFSFFVTLILSFGILFDFPVVLISLVKLGIIQAQTLSRLRRPVIVGIFILAAILTPSPDPVSQLLLALPLFLLFETSLLISRFTEAKKKAS